MKTSRLIRDLTALAVCGLMLSVVASSKHPVERPFKASGIVTGGSETSVDIVGTATHLGKFVSTGSFEITGVIFDGDQISKILLRVWGYFTSADGETLELEFPAFVIDYSVTPPTSSGVAYFKGGTGRFANASGSYVASFSPADAAPGVTQIYTAEGTISY